CAPASSPRHPSRSPARGYPARIFDQGGDGVVAQAVLLRVNAVESALGIAFGGELEESAGGRGPELVLGGLEELVDPLALYEVVRGERKRNRGLRVRLIEGYAEKARVARPHPELPLVINQSISREGHRRAGRLAWYSWPRPRQANGDKARPASRPRASRSGLRQGR